MTKICSLRIGSTYRSLLSVHECQLTKSCSRRCVAEHCLTHTCVVGMLIVLREYDILEHKMLIVLRKFDILEHKMLIALREYDILEHKKLEYDWTYFDITHMILSPCIVSYHIMSNYARYCTISYNFILHCITLYYIVLHYA